MEFIAESFESLCNLKRGDAMKKFLPTAYESTRQNTRKGMERRASYSLLKTTVIQVKL